MKTIKFKIGDIVRVKDMYDPLHVLTYSIGDVGKIIDVSLNGWEYSVKFDVHESPEWIFETWLEREKLLIRCE